jgi:hypothetical protein
MFGRMMNNFLHNIYYHKSFIVKKPVYFLQCKKHLFIITQTMMITITLKVSLTLMFQLSYKICFQQPLNVCNNFS